MGRVMRRFLASLIFAFGLVAQTGFAQEGPSKAEIVRILGEIPTFPGMRESIEQSGYAGENLDLAMAQMKRMLGDRQIANHIAERILAAGRGDWQNAQAAQGLLQPLLDLGMGHLAPSELVYFFKVEQVVVEALGKRDCGLIFKNRLPANEVARRTAETAGRLNTPALKEYYRIQYKAAKLGATRAPKQLSPAMQERVSEEIAAALSAAAEADPTAEAALAAFERLERVSNAQACAAGKFFLDVVMKMEPKARHEALLVLSVSE